MATAMNIPPNNDFVIGNLMAHMRRESDPTGSEIEGLIRSEDDPKTRTLLVILSSMSAALQENTTSTKQLTDRLDLNTERFATHEREEQEVLNQIKGAWKVIVVVTILAQAVGVYVYNSVRQDMLLFSQAIADNHDKNVEQSVKLDAVSSAINKLETRRNP